MAKKGNIPTLPGPVDPSLTSDDQSSGFNPTQYLANNSSGGSGSFDPQEYLKDELNEEKYGGVSGGAKAFGAGAARGATFGLSDQALVHSGLVNPETLKGLQETNPVSSGAGEITGIVAPALLGDEAGLANLPGAVSKLGALTEGKAAAAGAGKIAAKALGYGAEGAVYGAGQSVSENALGDHDLVSEKTLANIGLSSAFMGGLGSLVGKFGKAAVDTSSAEDKFLAKKIEQSALPGSDEAVISQTDLPAEDKLSFIQRFKSQKPGANALRSEFKDAGLPEVLGMMSDSQTVQKYASAISQLPTMAGDAVRRDIDSGFNTVNGIIKDSFNVVPGEMMDREAGGAAVKNLVLGKFEQMNEPLKNLYKAREALGKGAEDISEDKALQVYEDLVAQSKKFKNVTNEGRPILEKAANDLLKEAAGGNGFSGLDEFSKDLGNKGYKAFTDRDWDIAAAYRQAKETVDKLIDEHIESMGKSLEKEAGVDGATEEARNIVQEYKDLKAKYASFKKIMTDFSNTTGLGKRATTETGLNEALSKVPNEQFVDKIFDPKNAEGLRQIKENFPDVFTALTAQKKSQMYQNAIAKNKAGSPLGLLKDINIEQNLSKGVKKLLFSPDQIQKLETAKKWIDNLPAKVGPSGTPEGLEYFEMAKKPIKSLIGHGANEAGSSIGTRLIESLIKPEEEAQLKSLINLNKAQEKIDKSVTSKIKDILSTTTRPVVGKIVSKFASAEMFNEKADEIREHASNPSKMMDKLSGETAGLYEHAPNVSDSMKQAFVRGTQFLNSKLPSAQPNFFGEKPELSKTEMAKFERYYNVVENPLHALEQVRNGTIGFETVEALTQVYPKLYMDMSKKFMDEIASTKDKSAIPYQTRQSISQFIGQPLDQSLSFPSVMNNQQAFQPAPKTQGPPQKKPRTSSIALGKIDTSNRFSLKANDETG